METLYIALIILTSILPASPVSPPLEINQPRGTEFCFLVLFLTLLSRHHRTRTISLVKLGCLAPANTTVHKHQMLGLLWQGEGKLDSTTLFLTQCQRELRRSSAEDATAPTSVITSDK